MAITHFICTADSCAQLPGSLSRAYMSWPRLNVEEIVVYCIKDFLHVIS